MRTLLFGKNGQLGYELQGPLACLGEVVARGREVDLADAAAVSAAIDAAKPDAIVNAAAFNEVDRAEAEPALAFAINTDAVEAMGRAAKRQGIPLVHYSTDFVFDGEKRAAYTESDAPKPLSSYGRSKLEGERRLEAMDAPAFVLRTAWVYSLRRKSFVFNVLKAAREKERLTIVDDQFGSPTFARDLAVATAMLLMSRSTRYGLYHLAGEGCASRYELACAALEASPDRARFVVKNVERIRAADLALPAPRPSYAPLDCTKARSELGIRLPGWREALHRALTDVIAG